MLLLYSTYRRAEFVDNVGNVVTRVKLKVAGSVGLARAESAGKNVELHFNGSTLAIVVKLSNQVLAQIGNVGHGAHVGVQDERVRMGIRLAHANGGIVIAGVVDTSVLLGGGDHALALLGIVHAANLASEFARLL